MDSEDTFALPKEETKKEPFIEESFPMVDPDQVEKELTQEFIKMQENMPAQDVAAHFFQMYYPIYVQLLNGLSNKDARRVAQHVVQWPLEDENPKFNDEKAKQAFAVGIRLNDCKMIMKTFVEMERTKEYLAKKAENEKQEAEKSDTLNTDGLTITQGEKNNGN